MFSVAGATDALRQQGPGSRTRMHAQRMRKDAAFASAGPRLRLRGRARLAAGNGAAVSHANCRNTIQESQGMLCYAMKCERVP